MKPASHRSNATLVARLCNEDTLSMVIAGVLMIALGGGMFMIWRGWQQNTHVRVVGGDVSVLSTSMHTEVAHASDDNSFLTELKPGAHLGEMTLKSIAVQDKKAPISSENVLAIFTGDVKLDAHYSYDTKNSAVHLTDIDLLSLAKLPMVPGIKNPTSIDIKLTPASQDLFAFGKQEKKGSITLTIKQYLIDATASELSIRALAKDVIKHSSSLR